MKVESRKRYGIIAFAAAIVCAFTGQTGKFAFGDILYVYSNESTAQGDIINYDDDWQTQGEARAGVPLGNGTDFLGGVATANGYVTDILDIGGEVRTGLDGVRGSLYSDYEFSFRKDNPFASLSFDVKGGILWLGDWNGLSPYPMESSLALNIWATNSDHTESIFQRLEIQGNGGSAADETFELTQNDGPLTGRYSEIDDGFGNIAEARYDLDPQTLHFDLGSFDVGDVFDLHYEIYLDAKGEGGESWARASFFDPLDGSAGSTMNANGLTMVPEPGGIVPLMGAMIAISLLFPSRRLT